MPPATLRASGAATGGSATSSADAAFTVRRVNAKVRPSGVARVRSGNDIDYSCRTDACRAATVARPAIAAKQRRGRLVLEQWKSISEAAGPAVHVRAAWRASRHRRYTLDPMEAIGVGTTFL